MDLDNSLLTATAGITSFMFPWSPTGRGGDAEVGLHGCSTHSGSASQSYKAAANKPVGFSLPGLL